jgi:hypothetical protein
MVYMVSLMLTCQNLRAFFSFPLMKKKETCKKEQSLHIIGRQLRAEGATHLDGRFNSFSMARY